MTLLELIQKTTGYFQKMGVPDPRLDAELLLAHQLGLKRIDLYLRFDRQITDRECDGFRSMVKRRALREPLQHILGTVNFFWLELVVSRQALIPRPETEILVETAIAKLKDRTDAKVLDIGTGSGAIGLVLAHVYPNIHCVATDLSEESLNLARLNAQKTGLQSRLEFRCGNLFEPLVAGEKFDLIVSNPPYIPTDEIPALQPEVRYDPFLSLDGGVDGLLIIRKLIHGASYFLKTGGWFLLEIGHDQADTVESMMKDAGLNDIEFIRDLHGIRRIAQAQKISDQ